MRQLRKKVLSVGLAPVLVVGGVTAVVATATTVTKITLTAGADVNLIGKGHGHGRGMGQWGAFGYAKKGWPAEKILSHFYGGTTAGKTDKPVVLVRLTKQGAVNVRADAGMRVGGQTVAPGQAVRLTGSTATVTAGCNGPVLRTVPLGADGFVDPVNAAPSRPANELLRFCGNNAPYRGGFALVDGKVVNRIHIDDYVKGVIPRESLPRWADEGGAEALKAQGARVAVTEIDPINALQAMMDGFEVKTVEQAIGWADIVITATGNKDIITLDHMRAMKDKAILGNIGHFDNEIDMARLERDGQIRRINIKPQVDEFVFPDGHSIIVLSEGRLLNLGNATGHPSFVMSNSFSNQVIAQIELWTKNDEYDNEVYRLPKHLDEKVAKIHVEALGGTLTKLTKDQAEYIGVDVEGPYKPEHYRY